MEVIECPADMQSQAIQLRGRGKLLALVPTMGALHEGHLRLIDTARQRADVTVVSLFVNPTQFGPNEDLAKYPRDLEGDLEKCRQRGVDFVFAPPAERIYPPGFSTYVVEESVGKRLEGESRPGHFRGVATVVTILFHLCRPDVAVFGQKDAQQVAVIRRVVRDLWLPVEIVVAATVREADGLAMSSRNAYLAPAERQEAATLHAALQAGRALVLQGITTPERVRAEVMNRLRSSRCLRMIYVEIVHRDTMEPERVICTGQSLIVAAVWLERTRLIDNLAL